MVEYSQVACMRIVSAEQDSLEDPESGGGLSTLGSGYVGYVG